MLRVAKSQHRPEFFWLVILKSPDTVLLKIKERRAKLVDSSSWTESELFTVAVFKKLKREGFKGLKILQKEINKDNQTIDYKFSLDGNVYYLEVKKSVNAILGSFGLHFKTSETTKTDLL